MGIEGNDRADEIAKEATELEPGTEATTTAKLHRQLRDKLKAGSRVDQRMGEQTDDRTIRHRRPFSTASGRIIRVPHA